MNIGQARSLLVSIKKVTLKKCGACGGKRAFAIVSRDESGRREHYCVITCKCSRMEYGKFNR